MGAGLRWQPAQGLVGAGEGGEAVRGAQYLGQGVGEWVAAEAVRFDVRADRAVVEGHAADGVDANTVGHLDVDGAGAGRRDAVQG
ncbi:hypothetical protein [Saccharothrix variisporea]|uniref:hypothetical protein n=1 Tax=Saccharothrix variisporea TaxID=543527 RepID=UPI000EB455C0|nr:hypothetical protein [Saccharothrix variisporea]